MPAKKRRTRRSSTGRKTRSSNATIDKKMATLRQMDQRLGKVVPTLPVKDQNRVLSAFERHGTEGLSAFPDDVRNLVLQAEREMKKR